MEARHSGSELRTRDAIEQTSVVLVGTVVEPGTISPGPPGAQHIDDVVVRIDRTLSPGSEGPAQGPAMKLSYTRQVFPEAAAETPLQPGGRYVLFCTPERSTRGLFALKAVPHNEEAVRVVLAAFQGGAQHQRDRGDDTRLA